MALSQTRANSAATNRGFRLRAAVEVREIQSQRVEYDLAQTEGRYAMTPNYEVVGECGHRLAVIGHYDGFRRADEERLIEVGTPRKRRCESCPRDGHLL